MQDLHGWGGEQHSCVKMCTAQHLVCRWRCMGLRALQADRGWRPDATQEMARVRQ